MTIVVFKSADGWRFRIVARNGQIVAQSESYTRKEKAEQTARSLAKGHLRAWPIKIS